MDEIDQYISKFPKEVQQQLQKVRAIIKKTAPKAIEQMAYGMPGYKTNGKPLVYFAGYKNHIGFMRHLLDTKHFKKSFPNTNREKARCNFHWTNPYLLTSLKKSLGLELKKMQNINKA